MTTSGSPQWSDLWLTPFVECVKRSSGTNPHFLSLPMTCLTTIEQLRALGSPPELAQPNCTFRAGVAAVAPPPFGRERVFEFAPSLKKTEKELGPQNPTTKKKEGVEAYSTRRCLSD